MSQNPETSNTTPEGAPQILSINVAEDIQMEDMGLGGSKKTDDPVARYNEEIMKYLGRYVAPHNKKSRWVNEKDINRVVEEGQILLTLCTIPRGMYNNISAIAHSQIDDKDPLRFFVLIDGRVIINPKIINHTKVPVESNEGCLSLPEEMMKKVPRFHKVTFTFQTLVTSGTGTPKLSETLEQNVGGPMSFVVQHEICHCLGKYYNDDNMGAEDSLDDYV